MSLFPSVPSSAARKILIVVDFRGDQYANMPGDEYAARVMGSVEKLASYDTVLLAAPDTKSGTVIKDRGGDPELFTLEIVEGAGHAGEEHARESVVLDELLEALVEANRKELKHASSYRIAQWIADRYGVELPEGSS